MKECSRIRYLHECVDAFPGCPRTGSEVKFTYPMTVLAQPDCLMAYNRVWTFTTTFLTIHGTSIFRHTLFPFKELKFINRSISRKGDATFFLCASGCRHRLKYLFFFCVFVIIKSCRSQYSEQTWNSISLLMSKGNI
jgi:hypothetical protein